MVTYVGILGALADKNFQQIRLSDKSAEKKAFFVTTPFFLDAFLATNVTMTTVCVTALLCFVLWVWRGFSAAISQKIVPLLRDVDEIKKKMWIHEEDLRSCLPHEEN